LRKLLLQLDSSPHPSVFDRVVALDGGADEVMSYGGVTENAVRDLVHGAIFTRGPKDLHNTAIFIGGSDMSAGEQLLAAVQQTFLGPLRVSVMLDSNGSNTTAVAAVAKLEQAAGDVRGKRVVVTAGTGSVGVRGA
jgi:methylenetetrahydrofolate/methylenetetrahydromethanopterin dehydrogenase (NADP+)